MSGTFTRTLPPPANWQDFERLCFDLYARMWQTNDAELHGRIGQPQAGVDVFGTDRVERSWVGVQSKGKDQGYGHALTITELKNEVEKAKGFRPKLDVFIVATTAPNDVTLQQAARDITDAHRELGLFEVRVTGWTTLSQRITDHPELLRKYFSDLAPVDILNRVALAIDVTQAEGIETRTTIERGHSAILAAIDKIDSGDPFQKRISDIAKLIEEGKPSAALPLLEGLWKTEGKNASARNRYRLKANIGAALFSLGKYEQGSAEMRAAYAEDPTWPGARSILAAAELNDGNKINAFELAKGALADDKSLVQSALVLIASAPDSMTLEAIEELVPPDLSNKVEVLLAFAQRARIQGIAPIQKQYLTQAAALNEEDWRVLAVQGEVLLDSIFELPGISITHTVPPDLFDSLAAAIDFLQRAWASLRKRDDAQIGTHVAANLLSALKIAGRRSEYDSTLNDALKIAPEFGPFLRNYAYQMVEADDWKAAKKAVESISADELLVSDRLLLAQTKIHSGEVEIGIHEAEALENELGQDKVAEAAAALQIEGAYKTEHFDLTLNATLARWPKSIVLRSLAHNLMSEDDPRRPQLLVDIRNLSNAVNDPIERMHAADALYSAKQFSAAADMYQGLYQVDNPSPVLSRCLRSLLYSERRKEARELFERLPASLRQAPLYGDIGVSIYEHSGHLQEARALMETLLSGSDVLRRRLHWMNICERLNDRSDVEAWLRNIDLDIAGEPQHRMQLAVTIDRILVDAKAFAIGYRALRDGYSDPRVHLGYMIGLVFAGKVQKHGFGTFVEVQPDSAVHMEEKNGGRKLTRILETLPEPNIERNEIALTDPFAKQLLGLKVGDEVEVPSVGAQPTVFVVREIRDKYLEAHFRSLERFETMFPGHPAFGSFQIDESKGDEKFKPIFDSVKQRAEAAQELAGYYRRGEVPLMLLSRASGNSPCDTWDWVIGQPNLPLRTCSGSAEFDAARTTMKEQDRAVVDPITLYGLCRLGIADKVRDCFSDLGVVQTTLDLFRRLAQERSESIGRGHSTLAWDGAQFRMIEFDEETNRRYIASAEEVLAFAESLTLVPSESNAGLKSEALPIFDECDPAFLDTIYAAQGDGRLLLCDDMLFRQLCKEAAGIDIIWTQPAVLSAAQRGKISPSDYIELSTVLAGADYQFTSLDGNVVFRQLEKDGWKISRAFRNIAEQIALPANNFDSVVRLFAQLIKLCWFGAPDKNHLRLIIQELFGAFLRTDPGRNMAELIAEVLCILEGEFLRNANRTLFRRHLMDSTIYTSAAIAAETVNRSVDRLVTQIKDILDGALVTAKVLAEHDQAPILINTDPVPSRGWIPV